MSDPAPDAIEALRKAFGDDAVDSRGLAAPASAPAAARPPGLAPPAAPPRTRATGPARPAVRIAPADAGALARGVAVLAARGLGVAIEGGGSRVATGNPLRGVRAVLATERLAGVLELDADEGVAHVRAGTPLAALRTAARESGWELPLDPPGARSTLGGALAAAAIGPRHTGFGRPRDAVLGLEVVLGDGTRVRCGGRVVKNVTGYDLMKLHVGAWGAYGVIASAWIRLRPRAECERALRAALAGPEAVARGLALARLPTVRACALVAPSLAGVVEPTAAPASGWLASVELAGDEAAVERDARRAADAHGADDASPGALARLRGLHGATFGPAGLRFRLAVLPSRLASVLEPLARGGGALLVHPASGLVYARFAVASHDGAGLDAAWRAARAAARAGGGDVLLEEVPDWARAARDVFGDPGDGWRLARALKERFDPAGVLNPGRFVGGL